jgi:putative transposase
MTNYRRASVPSASYFFTVNLADRSSHLLVDRIEDVRNAMRYVLQRHPFRVDAMAVLPDHLHAVWTLPPGDADYPLRWRLFKTWFSRRMASGEPRRPSRIAKGERGIWQRRYWEHLIRDENDMQAHVDYVHFNPVKQGHVARAADWPYSTMHRYVAEGRLAQDWGVSAASEP